MGEALSTGISFQQPFTFVKIHCLLHTHVCHGHVSCRSIELHHPNVTKNFEGTYTCIKNGTDEKEEVGSTHVLVGCE